MGSGAPDRENILCLVNDARLCQIYRITTNNTGHIECNFITYYGVKTGVHNTER